MKIGKAIAGVLVKRATKSVTSWAGGALIAAGGTAAYAPEILEVIPEQHRGTVMIIVGAFVILSRHRRELIEAWAKLRAEVKAAEDTAEKETGGQ